MIRSADRSVTMQVLKSHLKMSNSNSRTNSRTRAWSSYVTSRSSISSQPPAFINLCFPFQLSISIPSFLFSSPLHPKFPSMAETKTTTEDAKPDDTPQPTGIRPYRESDLKTVRMLIGTSVMEGLARANKQSTPHPFPRPFAVGVIY
jgi:hypothetical protein